jgi:hypothetical protein
MQQLQCKRILGVLNRACTWIRTPGRAAPAKPVLQRAGQVWLLREAYDAVQAVRAIHTSSTATRLWANTTTAHMHSMQSFILLSGQQRNSLTKQCACRARQTSLLHNHQAWCWQHVAGTLDNTATADWCKGACASRCMSYARTSTCSHWTSNLHKNPALPCLQPRPPQTKEREHKTKQNLPITQHPTQPKPSITAYLSHTQTLKTVQHLTMRRLPPAPPACTCAAVFRALSTAQPTEAV